MPITDPWKSDGLPIPPARAATPIQVFRYKPDAADEADRLQRLPNLVCLAVEMHEGPDPGSAVFRYVMDPRTGGPYAVEQALSTAYTGPYVVEVGDRLLVQATRPDGETEWIFDGYPMGWGGRLEGRAEGVALHAIGVAKRAFDATIPGALCRHADAPATVADIQTGLEVRFNPGGKPNATPEDADAGEFPEQYPTFLDPLLPTIPGQPAPQRKWTLAMAIRYLLFTCNADETYVKNPVGGQLDKVLVAREPKAGVTMDPNDASTYTAKDIAAADMPLKGQRWPIAVRRLTEPFGFGMAWRLVTTGSGDPATELDLFWNQAGDVKSIYLDQRGSNFDAAKNNVGAASMERDLSGIVNKVIAEGAPKLYETSFILECGFPGQASDCASSSALQGFRATDPDFATTDNFDKYRLFIFDETGEGHYEPASTTKKTTIPSLKTLLGDGKYVRRRRVPIGDLISTDQAGRPLRWRLAISTDYPGPAPGLWDGSLADQHWQHVDGGVVLLRDRIGVRLTCDDPNHWRIGKSDDPNAPFPDGIVRVVQCLAAPDAANPRFYLRLTCCVEGDQVSSATADRTGSSPLTWDIDERLDARDRLRTKIIDYYSEFNDGPDQIMEQDDTEYLKAEAIAVREAKEAGVFEAEVMIPYFTRAYQIGDRIDKIEGRELGFRTDGGGSGVLPVYPMVTAVRHDFSAGQRTYLTLSDRGMNHARRRRYGTRGSRYAVPAQAARPALHRPGIVAHHRLADTRAARGDSGS